MDKVIELVKYGFFGVITTVFNLIVFYCMIEAGINYLFSNVFSYFLAVIFSYYLNDKFVFKSKEAKPSKRKFIKFFCVRIGAITLDTSLLALLVSVLGMDLLFSKIFLSIVLILATYAVNKLFVFRNT